MPILVGLIYFMANIFIARSVDSNSVLLPGQGWMGQNMSQSGPGNSTSAIVQAAQNTTIKALPTVISVFIVVTTLTTANTALYIASRTLFGLTRMLEFPR